jgi:hypothetical protein
MLVLASRSAERTIPTVAGSLSPSRQRRATLGKALDLTFMVGSEEGPGRLARLIAA